MMKVLSAGWKLACRSVGQMLLSIISGLHNQTVNLEPRKCFGFFAICARQAIHIGFNRCRICVHYRQFESLIKRYRETKLC